MIIRISGKLAKKIHVKPDRSIPVSPNPYTDWSAHFFRMGRVQYIIAVNTVSLLSMVMSGRGITNNDQFLSEIFFTMRKVLEKEGFDNIYEKFIAPEIHLIRFCTALNPSVTGSINDLVYQVKCQLEHDELSLMEVSRRLNQCPMSYIGMNYPRDAFANLKQVSKT